MHNAVLGTRAHTFIPSVSKGHRGGCANFKNEASVLGEHRAWEFRFSLYPVAQTMDKGTLCLQCEEQDDTVHGSEAALAEQNSFPLWEGIMDRLCTPPHLQFKLRFSLN